MYNLRYISALIFIIISSAISFGQSPISGEIEEAIEADYYMFPIRPGLSNYLAGTMGELRQSHFHAGLDIKTGGVEGLPVYAAADGFISRINVSSFGYGNTLYIQHLNGTTTVYAHLQKFANDIHHFVKNEQYSKESFDVEITPDTQQFIIKKGQIIALSGNSGSSGGPHLHFEIRDKFQKPMNPLKYKWAEIKDNVPPTAVSIAIKTLDLNARVNGSFGYFTFTLSKNGSKYAIKDPIHIKGKVGIEILAYDQMNESSNQNGVPCIDLYLDNIKIFNQNIESFSFFEGRNILVHSNYQEMVRSGRRFNKLYVDHGNELNFYTAFNRGIINLSDTLEHNLKINLYDPYNNLSTVDFSITGKSLANVKKENVIPKNGYEIIGHTLQLYNTPAPSQTKFVKLFTRRMALELSPSYSIKDTDVYLWDLRMGLPDSLDVCGELISFNLGPLI
ncbi:MAG: M23 family metallopeptidase, partial [Bacteroidota bacterium]|nr:M23 family metallopeptidase [Bacteroidota bacterium]